MLLRAHDGCAFYFSLFRIKSMTIKAKALHVVDHMGAYLEESCSECFLILLETRLDRGRQGECSKGKIGNSVLNLKLIFSKKCNSVIRQ